MEEFVLHHHRRAAARHYKSIRFWEWSATSTPLDETHVDFMALKSVFEVSTSELFGTAKYSGSDILDFLRMKPSNDELID